MQQIEVFKALADSTRLTILQALHDKERCICELIPLTQKSQPNVSQHIKILRNAGLVSQRKQGNRILIKLAHPTILDIIKTVQKL